MSDKAACHAAAEQALHGHASEIAIKQQGGSPEGMEPALKRSKLSDQGGKAKAIMVLHECVQTLAGKES